MGEETMTDSRSVAGIPAHVLTHLREHSTITVATVSPTGEPHASTLLYATDGLALYAWARADSATARHAAQHPVVAFTVASPDGSPVQAIEGTGSCRILRTPDEIAHAGAWFQHKFPHLESEPDGNLHILELTPAEIWVTESGSSAVNSATAVESGHQVLELAPRRVLAYSASRQQADHDAAAALTALDTVRVPAGAVIVRQGTPANTFYIILDGAVAVLREEAGQSRQVEMLRRGQFFGEIALLRDVPRTATVQALVPTTLLALDRAAFRDLVLQSLGTASDLERIIEQRLSELGGS